MRAGRRPALMGPLERLMSKSEPLPSMQALRAFESAARL
ncbi:LysR family transcriptional regulator, partial [Burkholderia contaminans]